eukprot:853412-Amphidinium_carterae.1
MLFACLTLGPLSSWICHADMPISQQHGVLNGKKTSTNIPWVLSPFVVDAAYTFVVAINNLLNAGIPGCLSYYSEHVPHLANLPKEDNPRET